MSHAHTIVVGLGFGDEGKGSLVDALVHKNGATGVIRFNGGPQAAHHVVNSAGQVHCFSQFGSGSLRENVQTFLSRDMIVDPLALEKEANALKELGIASPLSRVTIDERCVLVTPFHKFLNRIQELSRGNQKHGSCGMGVGQAWLDSRNSTVPSVTIKDCCETKVLQKKLRFLQLVKLDQAEQLADVGVNRQEIFDMIKKMRQKNLIDTLLLSYTSLIKRLNCIDDGSKLRNFLQSPENRAVFEGAQGVLLDAERGFWPHVTPSYTTFQNAANLLQEAKVSRVSRIGLLRAYSTRHGAGPFVAKNEMLEALLPEAHNIENPWQGKMRVGWFDLVSARYALDVVENLDQIAITNLDRLTGFDKIFVCVGWRYLGNHTKDLEKHFSFSLQNNTPVIERIRVPKQTPNREYQGKLSKLLLDCEPVLLPFKGWKQILRDGTDLLSKELEIYLEFLSSSRGINTPICILSTGPTSRDKLYKKDEKYYQFNPLVPLKHCA